MDLAHSFEPTMLTLAIFMVIPLLYFLYHYKFWYNVNKLRLGDTLLFIIAFALFVIVAYKSFYIWKHNYAREYLYFTLLHLGPLIQAFIIITFKDPLKSYLKEKQQEQGDGVAPGKKGRAVDEKPLNRQIEHLTWDDLIISQEIKNELLTVIELLRDPKTSSKYGISVPKGIILSGPPGNGKTTIAKVVANTAGLNFFSFSADEVISKWVGESEKNMTRLFNAAEKYKPAIVFIDEIDSIGRVRSNSGENWSENLLNHFLQIIDGVYKKEGIYIIGATNRPDLIDPALKRSGRLNKEIVIPPPDINARIALFKLYLSKLNLNADVDLEALASATNGISAADVSAICNQAGLNSFQRETIAGVKEYIVNAEDLKKALAMFITR